MNTKYEMLTNNTEGYNRVFAHRLYRIRALMDFADVKKGDLGGFIEKTDNLSFYDDCWVYNDAKVYDDAKVWGSAKIKDNATVKDKAKISGMAIIGGKAVISDQSEVYGEAQVFENAIVSESCRIYSNAKVYGNSRISDNSIVRGNAKVYGRACIHDFSDIYNKAEVFETAEVFWKSCVGGEAKVYGNCKIADNALISDFAEVFGQAKISGNAKIFGKAVVCESMAICSGACKSDLRKDKAESIRCQTGLGVFNNKVIAYKEVRSDFRSFHDRSFVYKVGEVMKANYVIDSPTVSCGNGLHFSNMNYWNLKGEKKLNSIFLMAEIDLKDIIAVQEGKIRCSKATILAKYKVKKQRKPRTKPTEVQQKMKL